MASCLHLTEGRGVLEVRGNKKTAKTEIVAGKEFQNHFQKWTLKYLLLPSRASKLKFGSLNSYSQSYFENNVYWEP